MGVLIRKGIPYGGSSPQVQSDWDETEVSSAAYILNKPTALSDFTNDLNFITKTVSDLTNYYTKTQVDEFIDLIPKFKIKVVPSLLVVTDPNETTVYLVPSSDPESSNIYTEYIYVIDETTQTGTFEKIGTQTVDLSNYIQKSSTAGLVKNDGTIDGNEYIPKRESKELWVYQSEGGESSDDIWTDGDNLYYSNDTTHYILDKTTFTWETTSWSGLSSFYGQYIWTDGENIYYSNRPNHYVLNKATKTWSVKTWNNIPNSFDASYVWLVDNTVYYSQGQMQYVLDKTTDTWSVKNWDSEDSDLYALYGNEIWTDGTDVYFSEYNDQWVLDKSTLTWYKKEWSGRDSFTGDEVWSDGIDVYYSEGSSQYILNKNTSTWIEKEWTGLTEFYGNAIFKDNTYVYCINVSDSFQIYTLEKTVAHLLRSDGTEDLNTYITSTDLSNYYTSAQTDSAIETAIEPLNKVRVWDSDSTGSNPTTDIIITLGEEHIDDPDFKMGDILVLKINRDYTWNTYSHSDGWFIYINYGTPSSPYYVVWPTLQKNPKSSSDTVYFKEDLKKGEVLLLTCIGFTDYKPIFLVVSNSNSVDLTNYIQKSSTTGLVKNDGTIDTNTYAQTSDLSNYIEKSATEGLVMNDGTIDTSKHVHLQPTHIEEFQEKIWNGLAGFYGNNIWTDEDNIYFSYNSGQFVLDKSTSTWSTKTWNGLTAFFGSNIWTDGDNIYYSDGSEQYVLDKSTSTWNTKTWTGLIDFYAERIWTDGENIYYSYGNTQYVLDKSTSAWNEKTWNGYTDIYGDNIWTDEDNIYFSYSSNQYVLDKATSTWSTKTWNGLTSFYGSNIWTGGDNTYYSSGSEQYVLDKSTSTWSAKTWTGLTDFYAEYIWTDGENIYYSKGGSQYVFISETFYPDGYVKSDGTIDTTDISGKADKVTNATSDNFAKLDANGNLADSGYSANSFMRNIYLEQTVTLSTSAATTVTFSDSSITTTSVIDLAVSEWGLTPDDVTVITGVCTVVMPKVDSAHSVIVRIYVR